MESMFFMALILSTFFLAILAVTALLSVFDKSIMQMAMRPYQSDEDEDTMEI